MAGSRALGQKEELNINMLDPKDLRRNRGGRPLNKCQPAPVFFSSLQHRTRACRSDVEVFDDCDESCMSSGELFNSASDRSD